MESETLRIVMISDTHGRHDDVTLPEGDILIHAGDMTYFGREGQLDALDAWFGQLPWGSKETRIVVSGNHDVPEIKRKNCKVLIPVRMAGPSVAMAAAHLARRKGLSGEKEDQVEELEKKEKLNERRAEDPLDLMEHATYLCDTSVQVRGLQVFGLPWAWEMPLGSSLPNIPKDTDIVISHNPPAGSSVASGAGCPVLACAMKLVSPTLWVCGHMHGGHGVDMVDSTLCVNAAQVKDGYSIGWKPVVVDVTRNGKDSPWTAKVIQT